MEKLEKVEQVREKCNVSYEEAREALEACEYDVLEAIITIERNHKPVEPTAKYAADVQVEAEAEPKEFQEEIVDKVDEAHQKIAEEVVEAEAYLIDEETDETAGAEASYAEQVNNGPADPTVDQTEQHQESKAGKAWRSFCEQVKQIANSGMKMTFVAERNGERVLALPVLVLVIGMIVWGATLWLLIIGLFFGFRYHIEGINPFAVDVNDVMNKAADAAEGLKDNLA